MEQTQQGKATKYNHDEDRISQLPEHLKHHILTFIPTIEAATTSILSRSWKDLWLMLPSFCFDQNFYDKIIQNHPAITDEQVLDIIDEIFTRRSKFAHHNKYNAMLGELIFCLPEWPLVIDGSHLFNTIITRAIHEFQLEKFDLCCLDKAVEIGSVKLHTFSVSQPQTSSKNNNNNNNNVMSHITLREMRIASCVEARSGTKVLCLNRVKIQQLVLDRLLTNFTQLKSLELIQISGEFNTLNASCLKQLVNLCINVSKDSSTTFEKIVIDAPKLKHFIFHDESPQEKLNFFSIDGLALSKGLKSLDIKKAKIADEWLSHIVGKLTKLTRLILHDCYGLRRVKISSNSLRVIDVTSHEKLEEIRVTDTPNLQEFMYFSINTHPSPTITIPSIMLKDACSLTKANVSFAWRAQTL